MLHFSLCEALGAEPAGLQEAPERAELRRWGARDLPDDLVRLARKKAAADRAEAIRTYVRGTGPAADALLGLVGEKIDGLEGDPVETMRDTYQNIARTMINRVVMQDMKSLATGGQTQFGLDIARGFDVELNGVGKVSRDFATACDQFARFVTRNPNATYAGLDARTRRKAHLAMSLIQQGVPNAGALGFGVLLSPDLNRNKLAIRRRTRRADPRRAAAAPDAQPGPLPRLRAALPPPGRRGRHLRRRPALGRFHHF